MLLEVKNLWVSYEGAEVLKGISCAVEEGMIVTFLGSNGAGKSTTLRAICGLKTPDSGEIWFNGKGYTCRQRPREGGSIGTDCTGLLGLCSPSDSFVVRQAGCHICSGFNTDDVGLCRQGSP
jgi:ABC-type histidine transport system ATPase subunit